MKLTQKQKETIHSMIGEGFHTGFRKALESKESTQIWKLIVSLPEDEWQGILDFVSEPIIDYLESI